MPRKAKLLIAALLGICYSSVIPALYAQVNAGTFADGSNPAGPPGPFSNSDIWKLDPITGSVSMSIPIYQMPHPGLGPSISYILKYNSASTLTLQTSGEPRLIFADYPFLNGNSRQEFSWYAPHLAANSSAPPGPWTTNGPLGYLTYSTFHTSEIPSDPSCTVSGPYIYVDEQGVAHDLNAAYTTNGVNQSSFAPCTTYPTTSSGSSTIDGSTFLVGPPNGGAFPQVTYPDGSVFNGTLSDSNGNTASTMFTSTFNPRATGASTSTVIAPNASGVAQTWTIVTQSVAVPQVSMPEPTTTDMSGSGSVLSGVITPSIAGSFWGISSITLPNSTQYTFSYDPTYGTISKITFPTGGYVRFTWGIRTSGTFTRLTTKGMSTLVATDAYIYSGSGAENHWHYTYQPLIVASGQSITATSIQSSQTDPAGNVTSYTASPFQYSGPFNDGSPTYQEISRTIANAAGTLLRTISTSYSGADQEAWGLPHQVTTTYNDISPAESQTNKYIYDKYNNVVEKDESDFYSGSTPVWLRKTLTSFYWSNQAGYESAHIVNKPFTVTVEDGAGSPLSEIQYDYDLSTPAPHGNLVSIMQCASFSSGTCSSWLKPTTYAYDAQGERISETDPMGNQTTYLYTKGYITQTTRPSTNGVNHISSATFSSYTGQQLSSTDENSQISNYDYSDPLFRLKQVMGPVDTNNSNLRPTATTTYSDSGPSPSKSVVTTMSASTNQTMTTTYDGLGRTTQSQLSDTSNDDYTNTVYDALGQIQSVSNPFHSGTPPVTTFTYDALGRIFTENAPGATIPQQWSYAGGSSTFTDELGHSWVRTVDGLGRLAQVAEPGSLITSYAYDAVNNLLSVTQKGTTGETARIRGFTYDSLSRLVCASNPENASAACPTTATSSYTTGTVGYTYDANGNLSTKEDARAVTTIYTYDALNRLVAKRYPSGSGTPSSCYQYDASSLVSSGGNLVGRLTNSWTQTAACPATSSPPSFSSNSSILSRRSILAYDAMGHVLSQQQCTRTNCSSGPTYAPSYTYDLAGDIVTHSSGISGGGPFALTFTNSYDSAGHLCSVNSGTSTLFTTPQYVAGSGCTSANATLPGYSPAGRLMNATFGTGLQMSRTYDNRLRIASETDIGNATSNPTPGTATLTITGNDQVHY